MCGIIGYTGKKEAIKILLNSLEVLEYRGYDSAGIALLEKEEKLKIIKCTGRVSKLRQLCEAQNLSQSCGIGHTRWATHGGVNQENSHPHCFGKVTLVHNGIIENDRELIEKYALEGKLRSQTDSEVVAAVISHFYDKDPLEAIRKATLCLKGTF